VAVTQSLRDLLESLQRVVEKMHFDPNLDAIGRTITYLHRVNST
jgi:hypothetical protein